MFNRGAKEYQKSVKALFKTDDGQRVLVEWRKRFVYPNSVAETPEATYYNLALKQFVLELTQELKEEDLDKVEERLSNLDNEERY